MHGAPKVLICLAFTLTACVFAIAGPPERQLDGWGVVTDPDADCTIKTTDGKLSILVPGTPHNLNAVISGLNAPRVLRRIEGEFSVQVRVSGEFQPDAESTVSPRGSAFNGAGLLIWQDDQNFLRLERNVWIARDGQSYCYPPLLELMQDGRGQSTNPRPTRYSEFFEGDSTWFRLERAGNTVSASYSHDGEAWTPVKKIPVDFAKSVLVGVAAINTSKKPFEVTFSELQLTRPEAD